MLIVSVQNVIMLSVNVLSVVMLNFITLGVVGASKYVIHLTGHVTKSLQKISLTLAAA